MSFVRSRVALQIIGKILTGLESSDEVNHSDYLKQKVSFLRDLFTDLHLDVEDMKAEYEKVSKKLNEYERNPYEK